MGREIDMGVLPEQVGWGWPLDRAWVGMGGTTREWK